MLEKKAKAVSFRDLEIWRLGKQIVLEVYQLTQAFPKSELYGLASQMRRASLSIPSNISEGFKRFHNREYRQFLYVALGSCAELESHVEISSELGYLTSLNANRLLNYLKSESKMIERLIKKL